MLTLVAPGMTLTVISLGLWILTNWGGGWQIEGAAYNKKSPSRDGLFLLFVAGTTRLELATSDVTGRRSNQTELRPR